ncbi:glycosyltransferase family 39 protein [Candidatus Woesebacteria bacterium]|nr:glycosyltransferase family 39 protein [Candidatus Woesebacteria bacterium]
MVLLQRKLFWFLILVTLIGSWFRMYRLPDTLQFLGDQGRDAIRVARMFKQGDLVFIGPVTSIGNMYLGPLYYYFMVPWLWLTYPSPLGPAYAVGIISIITIPLMYFLGQELVGKKAALIATICITFSSVVITYSRFSWNPNPAPLIGLLFMWALHRAWKNHPRYWLLVAAFFSILIQLHYIALLSIFPALLVLILQINENIRNRKKMVQLSKNIFIAIGIGLLFLSPLVIFDMKHGGTNYLALRQLLGGENSITTFESTNVLSKMWTIAEETHGRSMQILFDMYIGQQRTRNTIFLAVTLLGLLWLLVKKKHFSKGELIVILFVLTAILGTSAYSHSLYDHYVLYVVPAVLLLFGLLGSFVWQRGYIGRVVVVLLLGGFIYQNLPQLSFKPTGTPLPLLAASAQVIAENIQPNEKYNIVLLSETKDYYGQNYRYFLDTIPNKTPLNPDHDDLNDVSALVVINEEAVPIEAIDELPIFEIATFKDVNQKQIINLPSGSEAYIWRK